MMTTTIIPVNVFEENTSIEYLPNGDYIEITIASNINTLAKSSKSGNKAIASVTGHAPGVTVTRTVTLICSATRKLS